MYKTELIEEITVENVTDKINKNFIDHLKHLTTVYHFKLCFY